MKRMLFHAMFLVMIASHSAPYALGSGNPSKSSSEVGRKEICPVCGMFVYKYPNWVAQIIFEDKTYAFFDGAKDMFKYYFDLKKYNPKKKVENIVAVWVTDYYTTKLIDGREAFYVVGSDVLGPMGRELVPHQSDKAAVSFSKDHGGQRILRFKEVDLSLLESLR